MRPFNHTGPGQRPDFVVPALAQQVAAAIGSGAPALLTGNLDPRRDLTDVRDVVRAYRDLLEAGTPGEVYNVCRGEAVSIREIASGAAGCGRGGPADHRGPGPGPARRSTRTAGGPVPAPRRDRVDAEDPARDHPGRRPRVLAAAGHRGGRPLEGGASSIVACPRRPGVPASRPGPPPTGARPSWGPEAFRAAALEAPGLPGPGASSPAPPTEPRLFSAPKRFLGPKMRPTGRKSAPRNDFRAEKFSGRNVKSRDWENPEATPVGRTDGPPSRESEKPRRGQIRKAGPGERTRRRRPGTPRRTTYDVRRSPESRDRTDLSPREGGRPG